MSIDDDYPKTTDQLMSERHLNPQRLLDRLIHERNRQEVVMVQLAIERDRVKDLLQRISAYSTAASYRWPTDIQADLETFDE